ncbi:MAG: response regulator transcription factor [Bacteroidota bacterium]
MINILIAEDHQVLIDGLRSMLRDQVDMRVVGEAITGPEVFHILRRQQVDVLLLDLELPGMSGEEICKELPHSYPTVRPLILTMHQEKERISALIELGARGYLFKNTDKDELLEGIRAVMEGRIFLAEAVAEKLQKEEEPNEPSGYLPKITRRERQVLALIVEGLTNSEIASQLHISIKTVDSHRTNLLEKLSARNTASLVRIALEQDLV